MCLQGMEKVSCCEQQAEGLHLKGFPDPPGACMRHEGIKERDKERRDKEGIKKGFEKLGLGKAPGKV